MSSLRWLMVALACSLLLGGCKTSPSTRKQHRRGPKVNLVHFRDHTDMYRGRTIQLILKAAEAIDRSRGESLRDYVGRDVPFITPVPGDGPLTVVISVPEGLAVPLVGASDDVCVTFVCTRGQLRQGNVAKAIELP